MSSRRHGYRRVLATRRGCGGSGSPAGYLQLNYRVGTDNRRAKNFGSATDYRRPSRASDFESGEEIAMVLSLEPDATAAPNPTSGKPVSREGCLS
jgi:hypothetical protein